MKQNQISAAENFRNNKFLKLNLLNYTNPKFGVYAAWILNTEEAKNTLWLLLNLAHAD